MSSTVPSARLGYVSGLVPVFVHGDVNRVGSEDRAKTDAANTSSRQPLASLRTATTTAQAVANLAVGAASVAGVDFGSNFSTIVNATLDGQGSLRWFLANANALGGEASLSQIGTRLTPAGVVQSLPAGKETSIFMVPNGGTTAAGNVRPGFRPFDGTAQGGLPAP